ncbi:putative membrane protein [Spathaspora sp. JA1]|nr:putative membrane protein [Spathaspora sp. JA1]
MSQSTNKLSFREQMKGFPVKQMAVISLMRFAEPLAFTSLFPYVYFMIRDFGIAETPADIATYSGYLAASFALFQFLCCVQWGKASDRHGRKPILLCGLAGTSLSIIIFGFSPNYYVAIFARSLMGCLNGNVAVLRTAIGEIATERRHQGVAFSSFTLLWNIGAVIGPMIGGSKYLTRPKSGGEDEKLVPLVARFFMATVSETASNPDSFYERFLNKYPYALSNLVVGISCMVGFTIGFLFLEEPHESFKKRRDIGLELGDYILSKLGYETPERPWQKKRAQKKVNDVEPEYPTEVDTLIPKSQPAEQVYSAVEEDIDDAASIDSFGPISRRFSTALVRRYSSAQLGPMISHTETHNSILTTNIGQSFSRDIFTPPVLQTIMANFLTAFHNVIYSEFLPVLLAGQFMPEKLKFPFTIVGGFGYDSSTIGNLLSITGLIGALGVMFVFPILDRNLKAITTLRLSTMLFPITYSILPYLIFTRNGYNSSLPPWLTSVLLYGLCCYNTCAASVSFPTIMMLMHRASPPKHRAFINGSALSMNSLARFIGPICWGYIMTATDKYSVGEISWFLLALLSLVCTLQAFHMRDYEEEEEAKNAGEMRGFPVWQMAVISCMRFAEPLAFTSPFPYLYFMIRDFNIAETPADIAKYSGYLAASFALFQFLFCVQWGKVSDKVGRKPILLCGLAGTALSITIFGFSPNFYVAMFARSLMGCLNGNVAVLRTAIGEVAHEKKHQGLAFSSYSLLWNIGSVIGPMIGGSKYLTRPKSSGDEDTTGFIATMFMNPSVETSGDSAYERFLNKHPYALSNIVVGLFCTFGFTIGLLFLEEPNERFKKRRDVGLEIGDFILKKLGYEMPVRPWNKSKSSRRIFEEPTEASPLIQENSITRENRVNDSVFDENGIDTDDELETASIDSYAPLRRYSAAMARRYSSNQLGPMISSTATNHSIITTNVDHSFSKDIFTPQVVQTIVANFLSAFHYVIYTEFLPVLLAGQFMPEKLKYPFTIVGGFGYDSNMIGNLLSSTGLIGAFGVLLIFPYLDRNYKTITTLRFSTVIFPISYTLLPFLIFTRNGYDSKYPPWLTQVLLYMVCCMNSCSMAVGFPNLLILIHRAASPKHRAFINGTGLSLNSLARCIGPISWGYLMTFCEHYSIGELSWFILGLLSLACCLQSFYMKEYDAEDHDTEASNHEDV